MSTEDKKTSVNYEEEDLIDVFMGRKPGSRWASGHKPRTYANDWNYLMCVVQKIESLPVPESPKREYIVTIDKGICIISENGENPVNECQGYDTRIENTYHCVVDFIKAYTQPK